MCLHMSKIQLKTDILLKNHDMFSYFSILHPKQLENEFFTAVKNCRAYIAHLTHIHYNTFYRKIRLHQAFKYTVLFSISPMQWNLKPSYCKRFISWYYKTYITQYNVWYHLKPLSIQLWWGFQNFGIWAESDILKNNRTFI